MGALERYILRSAAIAFLGTLLAVTGVVWMSQSLREFDLITTKGQSFWTYLLVTFLGVPSFALFVAPVALFGAVAFVLNRLNTDSELAAISAAGVPPTRLLRPFLTLTVIVAVVVGVVSLSAVPAALRVVRELLTEIRADIVVNVLREGEFTKLDNNLTLHVRRRDEGAALLGVLIDDNRDPEENVVYTAERGQVLKTDEGTFLVLQNGAMQRKGADSVDANVILFDRYAFDLSPLTERELVINYRPRELYLSELWAGRSAEDDQVRRRLRAELHERVLNPIYPFVFMCIAFAALCRPHTTRQGRFKAIIAAVVLMFSVRLLGLGLVNLTRSKDWAVPLVYLMPVIVSGVSLAVAFGTSGSLGRLFTRTRRPAAA